MEPEELVDGISAEISKALRDMAKAKSSAERVQYSEIIKNLCDALGVFLGAAAGMQDFDAEDLGSF